MTLVARGPGKSRLDLTLVSDADWDEMRLSGGGYRCEGCGGAMHLRALSITDPLPDEPTELRIFAHNPGEGAKCKALGHDESREHLQLKDHLARAARRAGWTAELEIQVSPECRADVLATNPVNGKTHVLEAQLATLSLSRAVERHSRYEAEFGTCTWTHTGSREWSSQVRSLQVARDDHGTVVGGVLIDLPEHIELDPTPLLDVVPGVLKQDLIYVWSGDWGTYVDRDAMSRGSGVLPQRRRRKVTSAGAARFCNRMQLLGEDGRRLIAEGIPDTKEFVRILSEAHEHRRRHGEMALSDRQWLVLAIAGEHPSLKVVRPELDRILDAIQVSAN